MTSTTLHVARRHRVCDMSYGNWHPILPGELYSRVVTFPGEEGHEDGTKPVALDECSYCANERGSWVQAHYGVPARIGGRVVFDGQPGRIVGFTGGHLLIRLDTGRTVPVHPRWNLAYEEAPDAG